MVHFLTSDEKYRDLPHDVIRRGVRRSIGVQVGPQSTYSNALYRRINWAPDQGHGWGPFGGQIVSRFTNGAQPGNKRTAKTLNLGDLEPNVRK